MKFPALRAALVLLVLAGPVAARTFSVPPNAPALTLATPQSWKVEEIEHGYSALSPGEDVFFSVEYAPTGDGFAAVMKDNDAWMAENEIKQVEPTREQGALNGVAMTYLEYDTTDKDGKTLVDLFIVPVGDQTALLTLWGSAAERAAHAADIKAIFDSVKPAAQ